MGEFFASMQHLHHLYMTSTWETLKGNRQKEW